MEYARQIFGLLCSFLSLPLLPVGKTSVTIWMLLYVATLLWGLTAVTTIFQKKVVNPALARSNLSQDLQNIVGMTLRYSSIVIGSVVILNTAGVDMTAFTVTAGAIGLGLSLGLQNLAKNFIGGIILLWERPIRLGDRVQIGGISGNVVRIALRATTIQTDDQLGVIIPNSDFMSNKIVNWSNGNTVRISIPIAVAITNDPERVRDLLLETVTACSGIIQDPPPEIFFDSFGEQTLNFILCVSISDFSMVAGGLRSNLNFAIHKRLKAEKISLVGEVVSPQKRSNDLGDAGISDPG